MNLQPFLLRTLKLPLLFFTFFIPLSILGQTFHLNGNFTGTNTEEIVLSYYNESANPVVDTLEIINGKFETTGTIGGVQQVFLRGNITSNSMEDPNLGFFFLEPGEITISLEEDNFQQMKVNGSPTHDEWSDLDKGQAILRKEINEIFNKISNLQKSGSGSSTQEQRKLNDQLRTIQDKMTATEIDYANNNPDSYLSPYFINFRKRNFSKDSLNALYSALTPKVKNSVYAEAIKKHLGAKIPDSGNKAINFTSKDINGNEISLDNFKGNYVLLDFWAGWCKPCLKNHPELKEIYNKYSHKGLNVLGVSLDTDEDQWKESIKKEDLDLWQHIYVGLDNVRMDGSISNLYGIRPIPAYILIDKEGVIVDRYLAADDNRKRKSLADLKNKLQELLE